MSADGEGDHGTTLFGKVKNDVVHAPGLVQYGDMIDTGGEKGWFREKGSGE